HQEVLHGVRRSVPARQEGRLVRTHFEGLRVLVVLFGCVKRAHSAEIACAPLPAIRGLEAAAGELRILLHRADGLLQYVEFDSVDLGGHVPSSSVSGPRGPSIWTSHNPARMQRCAN